MKPKILVGDDQAGIKDSPCYWNFMDNYSKIVDPEFTADPDDFIERARTGNYAALMIDLKWSYDSNDRTGYRVLEAVKDYAPIRILWTSERKEDRERGFDYGATHCIGKGMPPEELEKILI
jgi:DNA-binding response OmpR family regulator